MALRRDMPIRSTDPDGDGPAYDADRGWWHHEPTSSSTSTTTPVPGTPRDDVEPENRGRLMGRWSK